MRRYVCAIVVALLLSPVVQAEHQFRMSYDQDSVTTKHYPVFVSVNEGRYELRYSSYVVRIPETDFSPGVIIDALDSLHVLDSLTADVRVSILAQLRLAQSGKRDTTIRIQINNKPVKPFSITISYDAKKVFVVNKSKKDTVDTKTNMEGAVDSIFRKLNFENEIKAAFAFEIYDKISRENAAKTAFDILSSEKQFIGSMRLIAGNVDAGLENTDSGYTPFLDPEKNPFIDFAALVGYGGNRKAITPRKLSVDIDSVQIRFEDGVIKDILLIGETRTKAGVPARPIAFKNEFPITLTSSRDVQKFNMHSEVETKLTSTHESPAGVDIEERYLVDIHDFLFYSQKLVPAGNYIPENKVITLKNTRSEAAIQLYKKGFADDFDLRLYTDVTGLQKQSTNGLIQVDGRYNIILNARSSRTPMSRIFGRILNPMYLIYPSSEITLFHKVAPFITFSKIEDKGTLGLNVHRGTTLDSNYNSVNTFDLLKYSNLNLGVDLNLAALQMVDYNVNMYTNLVAGVFRTPVDSAILNPGAAGTLTQQNLLSWCIMPELIVQAIYSNKIDFDMRLGVMYTKLFNDKLSSSANEVVVEGAKESHYFTFYQVNFNIFADENDRDSWIFLRSTLVAAAKQSNLSLQLGYATSIGKLIPTTKPAQ